MGKTILVVENDSDETVLLSRMLEKKLVDYKSHFVRDGIEAQTFLIAQAKQKNCSAKHLPEFILLDSKLPRMDAVQFLKWLRAQPGLLKSIPVIACSSSDFPDDIHRLTEAGADAFLLKPVGLVELFSKLKEIQKRK